MEHKNLSSVVRQFKQTFSEQVLNALGKAVRFCFRVREITPYRLALGLIEVFATLRVETIADMHRAFNALCGTAVQYKPFHNQLVKTTFPSFMALDLEGVWEEELEARLIVTWDVKNKRPRYLVTHLKLGLEHVYGVLKN